MKKTVLITGITGDIGSAIALQFAREGWDILGQYNSSKAKVSELKAAIEEFGVTSSFFKVDFTSESKLSKFLRRIKKYEIHSLINNAGSIVIKKHFEELTFENLTDVFCMNTFAPILITTEIFPQMRKRKFGRVVNISSISAKYGGSSFSMHYGCSKRALEGLTKTLAREGARDNVLVNTIRPGVIDTAMHKKFPKDIKKRIGLIPMQKMGTPEDVAKMAFYLGSDENQFIANQIIAVAGGE